MKLIFVAGSWGSGTTAVIGALDSLGVPTFGPYFQSSDSRTVNTFESKIFRNLILKYVDEPTVQHKSNYRDGFKSALEQFQLQLDNTEWPNLPGNTKRVIALKMPLASICMPEICSIFNTKIIVVHRPFEEIEASRVRRKWPRLYGSLGAQHIYNNIFHDVIKYKLSFFGLSYGDFVSNTYQSLEKLIDYCELNDFQKNIKKAEKFVKKS